MKWIVQNNLHNEAGYVQFLEALDNLEQDYEVVKVVPFSGELIPDVDVDNPVMVMGSHSLVKAARDRGWTPGAYDGQDFDYRKWMDIFGDDLLNHDAEITRFEDVNPEEGEVFFTRPVHDFKEYAGEIIDAEKFKSWQGKVISYGDTLNASTLVIKAPVKRIQQEYRFFVVDQLVITGSSYKVGNRVISSNIVDSDVKLFVDRMVKQWQPDLAYVIDIARVEDGFKIIEFNCINSSGFYDCDCQKIIAALADLVKYGPRWERNSV